MAPIVTGYVSYDTTPWSEAWGGACLLLPRWRSGRRRTADAAARRPRREGPRDAARRCDPGGRP